jgi:FtsP/CotA-like multicopper oxidase with cupredoxin domain
MSQSRASSELESGSRPTGRGLSRRAMLTGAAASAVAPLVVGTGAPTAAAAPEDKSKPSNGSTRRVTIYAEKISDQLVGYGLAPGKATVPGPVLEMWEGDTLEIELVNTTDKTLSIHAHGVDYDVNSDGTPMNDSATLPGQRRTYVWRSHAGYRRKDGTWAEGSAGYWHYHDHAMGTDHGTEGLQKGLYGALIVRRRGDVLPDKQFTVVFNEMSINNQMAPNTPMFEARLGQRVEFIVIGHGNSYHTFHLHAHRWMDNRTGMREGPHDASRSIDNKDLLPGDSFGFQVIAGEGVGPGAWMYHCHVQFHSDGGMVGVFLVQNADGSVPESARAALVRFHEHHH